MAKHHRIIFTIVLIAIVVAPLVAVSAIASDAATDKSATVCPLAQQLTDKGKGMMAKAMWESCAEVEHDPISKYVLGIKYLEGKSVDKNTFRAVFYLKDAAELDYSPAQTALAVLYWKGIGVSKSLTSAYSWLLIASYGDDKDADKYIQRIVKELNQNQKKIGEKYAAAWINNANKLRVEGKLPPKNKTPAPKI